MPQGTSLDWVPSVDDDAANAAELGTVVASKPDNVANKESVARAKDVDAKVQAVAPRTPAPPHTRTPASTNTLVKLPAHPPAALVPIITHTVKRRRIRR